jgi:tetratricopeptide (TPR) repeat protein
MLKKVIVAVCGLAVLFVQPALGQTSRSESIKNQVDCGQLEDPRAAIEACTRWINEMRQHVVRADVLALSMRATRYREIGEYRKAADDITSKMRIPGYANDPGIFCERGEYYTLAGEYEKALSDFAKAATLPDQVSEKKVICHFKGRARLFVAKKEYTKALPEIAESLKIFKSDFELLILRAGVYESLKDVPRAIEDYKTVISFQPTHKEAHAALNRLGVKP